MIRQIITPIETKVLIGEYYYHQFKVSWYLGKLCIFRFLKVSLNGGY